MAKNKWQSHLLLAISGLVIFSADFTLAETFNVVSQDTSWSKTAIYPYDSPAEITVVENILSRIKPLMREDLRDLLSATAMVINHSERAVTETYQGWGPEDDPEYIEGDTKLFGSENGSIKINITEKSVVAMDLMLQLEKQSPNNTFITQALLSEWLSFFSHEVLHVKQFKTNPVITLRTKGDCPNGDCNSVKLKGTKIKNMIYEGEALQLGRSIMMKDRTAILAFADFLDTYESNNQEKFSPNGPWHLASKTAPRNPFSQYYLRNLVDDSLAEGEIFTEATNRVYNGQWKPATLVKDIIHLRANLKRLKAQTIQNKLLSIKKEWAQFQAEPDSPQLHPTILKSQPYQDDVQARFIEEITYIEKVIKSKTKRACRV